MRRFLIGGTPCANCGERVRSGTIACPHCKQRAWTSNDRDDEPVTGEPDAPTLADVLAAKDAENERLREALRDWRPIENAPRDWSWFLAWGEDAGHCVLRLGPNPIWSEEPEVTHWRPLPSAPALSEQEGK